MDTAWESINSRKFRFALNLIGILIGCAAVTGLISITQGLSDNISSSLQVFGPQNVLIVPGQIQMGRGLIAGEISYKELARIEKTKYISKATPIIANKFAIFNIRGKSYRAEVFGIEEKFIDINQQAELSYGRKLQSGDTGVVIVGSNIAQPKDDDNPIIKVGDRITIESKINDNIKTMTLRVIGILKETGSSFGVSLDNSIAISLRDMQQFFETGNKYSYVMAQADNIETVPSAVQAVKDVLGKGYQVLTYETAKNLMNNVIGSVQAVLGGIAAISLVVAGVGIINTMTISVMERTREIGVLKAIGAKSIHVMLMFLSEAVLTGIVGGVVGAILGFFLASVVGNYVGITPNASLTIGLMVIGFAIITSTLSGIYPAWRASNLNPVEALRHE